MAVDTCRDLADQWLKARAAAKPSAATLRAQRADLAVVAAAVAAALGRSDDDPLATWRPDELTLEVLEAAFAAYAATHAKASVLRARSTWNSFLNWMALRGAIPVNPLAAVPAPGRPKRLPKALDDGDLVRVLSAAWTHVPPSERDHPCVEFDQALTAVLFGGGLRSAEVLALTVSSVRRREENLVTLVVSGKGEKDRSVPLPPEMSAAIDRWLDVRRRRHGRLRPGDPLFVTPAGKPFTYARLAYRVRSWFRAAGVDGSPHVARHTLATTLTGHGMGVEEVSELLGHSSLQTTQIYQRISAARLQEGVMANPMRRLFKAPSA